MIGTPSTTFFSRPLSRSGRYSDRPSFQRGMARPLSPASAEPIPYRALHGLRWAAPLGIRSSPEKASPDPGYLAGTLPLRASARLVIWAYYLRRQQCSPDLPSNCSSLSGLNCTHSNYKTLKSPVSVFIVTISPCRDWIICAPAAFLGCSSRFSGSFSGVEP